MTDAQDMPDRIAVWRFQFNKATDAIDGGWSDDHDHKTTEYIRADLARPRVKPLVWERLKGIQTDFKAKCILGTYLVECFDDGEGDYYVWALEWGKIEGPKMESPQAAKAAAQDDYERRILEALE